MFLCLDITKIYWNFYFQMLCSYSLKSISLLYFIRICMLFHESSYISNSAKCSYDFTVSVTKTFNIWEKFLLIKNIIFKKIILFQKLDCYLFIIFPMIINNHFILIEIEMNLHLLVEIRNMNVFWEEIHHVVWDCSNWFWVYYIREYTDE